MHAVVAQSILPHAGNKIYVAKIEERMFASQHLNSFYMLLLPVFNNYTIYIIAFYSKAPTY